MKHAFALLLILFSISALAQQEIKLEELKDHIGDSVKVKGEIFGVRYLPSTRNTPTFINIGAAYPNQLPPIDKNQGMNRSRKAFMILGWVCMFLQLVGYLGPIGRKEPLFEELNAPYIIGYNFMLILGTVFFLLANRQKRKMRRKAEQDVLNSFLEETTAEKITSDNHSQMAESFELPVSFNGNEFLFPSQLIRFGYTYKIEVNVNGTIVSFERDEERNWRGLIDPTLLDRNKIKPKLIQAIIASLDEITKA